MSVRKISPLLDAMEIGACFSKHDGVSCYTIRHTESGREFVLKHLCVPASQDQVEALLLTGAFSDRDEAAEYYRKEAEALIQEGEVQKKLLDCPHILPFLGMQMEPKEEGVGYDVYAVLPRRSSLQTYLSDNAVSHLRGINMGIDLCVALSALREAGYVHGNLKPGNVFFSDTGRFLLGDFGLISTQDMQYGTLPEQYRSGYSAPELQNIIGGLNPTVDIYSLGMILYRIYNGNHAPFEDEKTPAKAAEERRLAGEPLPAPLYADYELAGIIQKAVAHDPADRFQTPDEMRLELENYMRRNAVSDHLIVPPIVTDGETLSPEQADEETEPVHFADPEQLDEEFKAAFAPDDGKKKKKKDKKEKKDRKTADEPEAPEAPAQTDAAEAPSAPDAGEPAAPEAPEEGPAPKDAPAPEKAPENAAEKAPEEGPAPEDTQPAPAPEPAADAAPQPEPALPEDPAAGKGGQKTEGHSSGRHKGRAWAIFAAVMILLVAFIGLYEFTDLGKGGYHYFVSVDKLEVSDVTADSMRLHLSSNIDAADFSAVCQDAYGNSFQGVFRNGTADFTGLTPGTQYTLKVLLDGFHKLSGVTTVSAATVPQTEVLTFSASLGSEEGAALLSLVVKDQNVEPEQWILRYGKTGGEQTETRFAGHSFQISGLEVGQEYRFTLVGTEALYLAGQLEAVFTPPPAVQVDRLAADAFEGGTASISWRCAAEPPEQWVLTCTGPSGEELETEFLRSEQTEDGWMCYASVSGVEPGVSYELKLSAVGLFQPVTLQFLDTAIRIDSLDASTEPGLITLSWSASREPEGGWIVNAVFGNGAELVQTVHGGTCTFPALPLERYDLTVTPAEDVKLEGTNTVSVQTDETQRFSLHGVGGSGSTIGTYYTPEKEDWTLADLGSGTVTFRPDDDITFVITATGSAQSADETVGIQYVVRDAEGRIVNVTERTAQWNDVFRGNLWIDTIPWIPSAPGSYSFTPYINCQRVTSIGFRVVTE